MIWMFKPAHVKWVLSTYANREGSDEPAHSSSLARAFAVSSYSIEARGTFRQRAGVLALLDGVHVHLKDC